MIHFTPLRKRPALSALMLLILGSGFCQAQEMLTDSARKEATEWLKEVKSGYLNTSSARIQKAVTALTAATSTENAAMKLYVDAMKDRFLNPTSMMSRMLNRGGGGGFRMMRMPGSGGRGGSNGNSSKPDSPSTAFSNWRKQNTGNNVAPGFKKALQIQCKWMLLCLRKADAEKNERELNVSSSVLSMLDEVAANAKDVGEQLPMVGGASEVIRSYLNISDYRSDTLPDNLMDLNTIFDRVLLAPYKEKRMWKTSGNSGINASDWKRPCCKIIPPATKTAEVEKPASWSKGSGNGKRHALSSATRWPPLKNEKPDFRHQGSR